jgi:hypothetical protein
VQPWFHYKLIVVQEWVLLAYRLPREPSTPRIALWRRLRRLGAAQVIDGLAALPLSPQTREQLEWLADEVVDAGGSATVWIAKPGTAAEGRALADRMRRNAEADYQRVVEAARGARDGRTAARLRRAQLTIRARDYFDAPGRREAERALAELGARRVRA